MLAYLLISCEPDAAEFPYATIQVNGKTWLAENLSTEVSGAVNYPDIADARNYGRLYTLQAARNLCASLGDGWRLPTDQDWQDLAMVYGGYYDWLNRTSYGNAYASLMAGGSSGFSATLGGFRFPNGVFSNVAEYGCYWTDSVDAGDQMVYYLFHRPYGALYRSNADRTSALSCRCIKY